MTAVPLARSDFRALVELVGGRVTDEERQQAEARCFVHDGRDPDALSITLGDDGFPVFNCHSRCADDIAADVAGWLRRLYTGLAGLGWSESRLRALPARNGSGPSGGPPSRGIGPTQPGPAPPGAPPPDSDRLERLAWETAVEGTRLHALAKYRGLKVDSLIVAEIGYDAAEDRYVLPVFDVETGAVVDLRRYRLGATERKMLHRSGGTARFYVPGTLSHDERKVLVEGEFDALMLWERGFNVLGLTGGAKKVLDRAELLRAFPHGADESVVIVFDRDDAGVAGAQRWAAALHDIGVQVSIATLPLPYQATRGHDVTDFFRDFKGSTKRFHRVLDEAKPWVRETNAEGLGSWAEEDLSEIMNGAHEPLQPSVARRAGSGLALFYRGKVHLLSAESEAGKTWLALFAAMQEIRAGRHVMSYDFEDDATGVVGRLLQMGVPAEEIRGYFHYVRPNEPMTPELQRALLARHQELNPSLVVVDGVTEVMTQNGWGQSANDDIAGFYNTILKPLAQVGSAVVALDHLPKYDEKKRGAIGGVHKLNGVDGAAYRLEAVKEIAPGRLGITRVKIDKDRPGQVKREQDEKKRIADLIVDAEGEGVAVSLELPGAISGLYDPEPGDSREKSDTESQVLAVLTSEWRSTPEVRERLVAEYGRKAPSRETVRRTLRRLHDFGDVERDERKDDKLRTEAMWRRAVG